MDLWIGLPILLFIIAAISLGIDHFWPKGTGGYKTAIVLYIVFLGIVTITNIFNMRSSVSENAALKEDIKSIKSSNADLKSSVARHERQDEKRSNEMIKMFNTHLARVKDLKGPGIIDSGGMSFFLTTYGGKKGIILDNGYEII